MGILARRRARTPEARENQLIGLAIDLAEKQLIEGTAPAMVVTHYLKLASSKDRLEREKLQREVELLRAKTEAYEAGRRSDEKYERALRAFSLYSGNATEDEFDD